MRESGDEDGNAAVILVARATGLLGSEVCRRWAGRDQECQALDRETSDAGKKRALKEFGATLVTGDLKDRDSLMAACRGDAMDMRPVLAKFPIQPTSVRDCAKQVLGARAAAG